MCAEKGYADDENEKHFALIREFTYFLYQYVTSPYSLVWIMLRILLTVLISICTIASAPGIVLCDTGDYHTERALIDHLCADHAVFMEIVSFCHALHHHHDLPVLFDDVSVPKNNNPMPIVPFSFCEISPAIPSLPLMFKPLLSAGVDDYLQPSAQSLCCTVSLS